jgi:hypothetical protein
MSATQICLKWKPWIILAHYYTTVISPVWPNYTLFSVTLIEIAFCNSINIFTMNVIQWIHTNETQRRTPKHR